MKFIALFLTIVICCGATQHHPIQSPKAKAQAAKRVILLPPLPSMPAPAPRVILQSPKAMSLSSATASATIPKTNFTRITFGWQYPNGIAAGFNFYFGGASRSYTNRTDVGTNLFYMLAKTNWTERAARHYFAVTAYNGLGIESDYSIEIFWPLFPVNSVLITWRTNWPSVTILHSTNFMMPRAQWQIVGVVTNGRCWTTNLLAGNHFFVINRHDEASIALFNPMNLSQTMSTICPTNFVAPPVDAVILIKDDVSSFHWITTGNVPELGGWFILQYDSEALDNERVAGTVGPGIHSFGELGAGFYRVVRAGAGDAFTPPFSNLVSLP